MVKEVTRYIDRPTERELWARAAGRCQFSACNKILFKSGVTQESVNLSQKAHIYSFSENGPRGWGPFKHNLTEINDVSNLMLMCHGCHTKIDQDVSGSRYSADLLIQWKAAHEQRVEVVTGISPEKKSHVVLYGANIGTEKSPISYHSCLEAMFPARYPANERPETLSMRSELQDRTPEFWTVEAQNLRELFRRRILPLVEDDDCKHFSVFALAPQPLLIELGALFTDKLDVDVYQPHREPKGWNWHDSNDEFDFIVNKPSECERVPVLVLSLSDHVSKDRIHRVLGDNVSIWEVTVPDPHNDFMQAKEQLSIFRKKLRKLMVDIKKEHGNTEPLHIFPVMPVSCALELGRVRMPKADMPWVVYDHDIASQEFREAIRLERDIYEQR